MYILYYRISRNSKKNSFAKYYLNHNSFPFVIKMEGTKTVQPPTTPVSKADDVIQTLKPMKVQDKKDEPIPGIPSSPNKTSANLPKTQVSEIPEVHQAASPNLPSEEGVVEMKDEVSLTTETDQSVQSKAETEPSEELLPTPVDAVLSPEAEVSAVEQEVPKQVHFVYILSDCDTHPQSWY